MPSERPSFTAGFEKLSSVAEDNWQNREVLQAIYEELGHRKAQAAVKLKARIAERLRVGGNQDDHARRKPETNANGGDFKGRIDELLAELASSRNQITVLHVQLRGALDTLEQKEAELRHARGWLEQFRRYYDYGPEVFATFAQVCLTPDCPDVIVKAVRKAYRREHHPDTKSAGEKRAAEETFKRIDEVFDRIEKLRPR